MEISGTKAAMLQILKEKNVYEKLGVSRSSVSNWKRALEGKDDHNNLTLDKMEELLQTYGATIVHEKVWNI